MKKPTAVPAGCHRMYATAGGCNGVQQKKCARSVVCMCGLPDEEVAKVIVSS